MVSVNWRLVHSLSYVLAFFFALEPSYIHPDEHFQLFEVLTNRLYGYSTNVPWEFKGSISRSFSILYLVYGPLFHINKFLQLPPLALLYMARLQLAITYYVTVKVALRVLCKTKQESSKALFFIYTSFITWTYQSHTFSNSIETQILLIVLSLIHILSESYKQKIDKPYYIIHALLGFLIGVGVFNRITFVAFLVFPVLLLYKRLFKFKVSFLITILAFVATSYLFILWDTSITESDELVIAPLNNLLYNSNLDNLSKHGLHPRYTHILVNLPQIIGPAIIPFIFRNHYKATVPYLSIFSGLVFLSAVPHQELRFLIPIVPLICMSIDLTNFESTNTIEWIMRSWITFNLFMGVLMGSLHQRGVLEALDHLRSIGSHDPQIWWKTYSPPTWILGSSDLSTSLPENHSVSHLDYVVDLMGGSNLDLVTSIKSFNSSVLLITPRSSVPSIEKLNGTIQLERIWSYKGHIGMDHFDFNDIRTFYPGIDIYNVTSLV